MVTHCPPDDLRPFAPSEIDARVARQRSLLARFRNLDAQAVDIIASRLEQAVIDGHGREDLFAALWVAASRDDVYDALAQQRQAECLEQRRSDRERKMSGASFLQGLLRVGFVAPPMIAATETIIEASIVSEDSHGSAYEFFLVWAAACHHTWLWEILQAAHKHSQISRRGAP